MMTIKEALDDARKQLSEAAYGEAGEARLLLARVMGISKEETLRDEEKTLTADQQKNFEIVLTRRCEGMPVARITGMKEFWGLSFYLNEHTLVPRPDSECVVACAVKRLQECQAKGTSEPRLLDLGTGSGCLLLSVLSECRNVSGVGVDCVTGALGQAADNARALGLLTRAHFQLSQWYQQLNQNMLFHVILANPPYISRDDYEDLSVEVKDHDPIMALVGGERGDEPYEEIVQGAPQFLASGGWLIVEISWEQGIVVSEIFEAAGFDHISVGQDLGGRDRYVMGRKG